MEEDEEIEDEVEEDEEIEDEVEEDEMEEDEMGEIEDEVRMRIYKKGRGDVEEAVKDETVM